MWSTATAYLVVRVLGSKSLFVNWLPRFLFSFLCPSSQIHQKNFKLGHNRLYICPALHSYIALVTTDCHLVGHVKKSVGIYNPQCDEWKGSVCNISCPGIKNLCAAGLKRFILKDFYTEWRRSDWTLDIRQWKRPQIRCFRRIIVCQRFRGGNFFLQVWTQLATFEHLNQ